MNILEFVIASVILGCIFYFVSWLEFKRYKNIQILRETNKKLFGELCYKIGYLHGKENSECDFNKCLLEIEKMDKEHDNI